MAPSKESDQQKEEPQFIAYGIMLNQRSFADTEFENNMLKEGDESMNQKM